MNHAAFIALVNGDSVLLQLRSRDAPIFPDTWGIPGGKVEGNESVLEGAIREFEEETGYKVKGPKKLGEIVIDSNGTVGTFYTEKYDQKQNIHCYEGQKMEFLTSEEIVNLGKIIPFHKGFSLDALKANKQ